MPARGAIDLHVTAHLALPLDKDEGEFTDGIFPRLPDGKGWEKGWKIQAVVKKPFTSSSREINFADSELISGHSSFPEKTLELTCRENIYLLSVNSHHDHLTARIEGGVEPNQFKLYIKPHDTLPVGSFSVPLEIQAYDQNCVCVSMIMIRVQGQVVTEVRAWPSTIHLVGSLEEAKEEWITLQSSREQPFDIEKVIPSSKKFTLEADEKNVQGKMQKVFKVKWVIDQAGSWQEKIDFLIRRHDRKQETVTIPVMGHGFDFKKTQ